jgi:hypothetical protein
MKLNVTHIYSITVDSAVSAEVAALDALDKGMLVQVVDASNDEDDFRKIVHVYEYISGAV